MSSPSDIRKVDYPKKRHLSEMLRLTGTRDRLIGCIEKESILGKDISTCLPVSLNSLTQVGFNTSLLGVLLALGGVTLPVREDCIGN